MKAFFPDRYGLGDMELKEVEKPVPKDDEVLVEVHASSVDTLNMVFMGGKPVFLRLMGCGFLKPKNPKYGSDFAGRVEAVGKDVTQYKPGDEVYGDASFNGRGSYAEYVCVSEKVMALKPANLSFEEAAAVPQAALVALQGLRDKGEIGKGKKVLIFGASGGIGTFAVQLAKYFGAEVTGVCSTKNVEMVKSLGADHVIDYTREDFSKNGQKYDLIFAVPTCSIFKHKKALAEGGVYVSVGSPSASRLLQDNLLGPMAFKNSGKRLQHAWIVHINPKDLLFMRELIEAGKIKPVIDRRYPLSKTGEAFRYYRAKHSRGKVVIAVK